MFPSDSLWKLKPSYSKEHKSAYNLNADSSNNVNRTLLLLVLQAKHTFLCTDGPSELKKKNQNTHRSTPRSVGEKKILVISVI